LTAPRPGRRSILAARALSVLSTVSAFALLALSAACTVGSGSGSAKGPLWVLGCRSGLPGGNLGTPAAPSNFSLDPIFFAGEPIEDVSKTVHENRLVIRMQRNGGPIEYNDTLSFDVSNSYEVARCIRGRTVGGVGDWDMSPDLDNWCDWSGAGATVDGGAVVDHPRIALTPKSYVQASLALLSTCPLEEGTALDPNGDFKVNFGDRLRASFHVELEDDRVITAQRMNLPEPSPRIGGVLDGQFDFDLERGRAAQPFP